MLMTLLLIVQKSSSKNTNSVYTMSSQLCPKFQTLGNDSTMNKFWMCTIESQKVLPSRVIPMSSLTQPTKWPPHRSVSQHGNQPVQPTLSISCLINKMQHTKFLVGISTVNSMILTFLLNHRKQVVEPKAGMQQLKLSPEIWKIEKYSVLVTKTTCCFSL